MNIYGEYYWKVKYIEAFVAEKILNLGAIDNVLLRKLAEESYNNQILKPNI